MSRLTKIFGYGIGGLAVVLIAGASVVYFSSNARLSRSFAVSARPIAIPSDSAALARGKHLANTRGCNDCHGKDFAGNKVIEDNAMGRLHAPNLTRGKGGRVAGVLRYGLGSRNSARRWSR